MTLISKQQGQLKKLEALQTYIKGPSSSLVRDFTEKIETYKHRIFELEEKLAEQETELSKLRQFYTKNTFFDSKKVIERSKSREKRGSINQAPENKVSREPKPNMIRNFNIKNDLEFIAMNTKI